MPIRIDFIADVAKVIRGTRDIEAGLDDVADSLDDLTRDADRTGDKIGDSLDEAARDADDAGDKIGDSLDEARREGEDAAGRLERTFRDTFRAVRNAGDDTGKAIGDDVRAGTRRAEEGVEELRDEAASSAREAGASFTGEFEDVADYLQEVSANALAGFGPAGAAAGLAAAAGIGLAITALQQAADEANELTERAAEWSEELATTDATDIASALRDRWREVATAIADVRSAWELWQPRAVTNVERFAAAADDGLVSIEALYEAFTDPDPENRLRRLREALDETRSSMARIDEQQREFAGQTEFGRAAVADQVHELTRQETALGDVASALEEQIALEEAATAITEGLARAQGQTVEEYRAAQEATEAARAAQESYNDAVAEAADPVSTYEELLDAKQTKEREAAEATAAATADSSDSWEDYADDVTVTIDDLIAELDRQIAEAEAFEENLAAIAAAGGQALADELRAKGPEVAGATAAVIAESDPAKMRAYIDRHAKATGRETAAAVAQGIDDNANAIGQAIRRVEEGLPTMRANVVPDFSDFDRAVRNRRPVITARVRLGQAAV